MHNHDGRLAANARNWSDVADEIEIELVVERRIDGIRRIGEQKGIAIRSRTHDCLGADVAASTGPILNDELLTEPLRQPLSDRARGDIGRTARRESDDDAHGPRWIALRQS